VHLKNDQTFDQFKARDVALFKAAAPRGKTDPLTLEEMESLRDDLILNLERPSDYPINHIVRATGLTKPYVLMIRKRIAAYETPFRYTPVPIERQPFSHKAIIEPMKATPRDDPDPAMSEVEDILKEMEIQGDVVSIRETQIRLGQIIRDTTRQDHVRIAASKENARITSMLGQDTKIGPPPPQTFEEKVIRLLRLYECCGEEVVRETNRRYFEDLERLTP
jgi:hypothetical protein